MKCVRVPFTGRNRNGCLNYTVEVAKELGDIMMHAVTVQGDDDVTHGQGSGKSIVDLDDIDEWCPEIGRGDEVVRKWMQEGMQQDIDTLVYEKGVAIATTDGSQKGQSGTYGWIMIVNGECYNSSGKVISKTKDMDAYRTELHGLMSLMAGSWKMRNAKRVKAKCDNESVVKGYKRIREWEKNGKQDEFPKFNHSVDLWEEVKWWSAKWDGKFELEWHKGHPEERDPTRESWCISDWMNHVADRLAESEYGKAGGDDNPGCLAHQSNWKLMHSGNRVTSMTLDALDLLQNRMMTEPMAAEQGIDMNAWDLRATKIVTGYDRVVWRRVRNMRTAWDRGSTRGNKRRWRTKRPEGVRRTMEYLKDDEKAWCKICDEKAVEDTRHYMCACANVHYKEVRKTWYAKVKAKVTDMSLRMQEAFMNTLVMVDGCLLTGVGEGVDGQLTAWDAVSGRIPILWTEAAMTDESDRDSYDAFLRWYGEQIHDNLWSKLWMIRTREMAMIEMKDEETSVYTSDIEEEDRSEEG